MRLIGTGRMDYPNQINNVLAFPGIFRGALEAQKERIAKGLATTQISDAMKIAAVHALANILGEHELSPKQILPAPTDPRIVTQISAAVHKACV